MARSRAAGTVGTRSIVIRVLLVAAFLFLPLAAVGLARSDHETTQSQTTLPTATFQVATVTTPENPFSLVAVSSTSTPTETATATATLTQTSDLVPRKEKENASQAPNLQPSLRAADSGPNEVHGAKLTIYACVGDNGHFCPDSNRTRSGTVLERGTASCDPKFRGHSFFIVGDPEKLLWTCLDTGSFVFPLFDLWFYNLSDGLDYLNNIPGPQQVSFVN